MGVAFFVTDEEMTESLADLGTFFVTRLLKARVDCPLVAPVELRVDLRGGIFSWESVADDDVGSEFGLTVSEVVNVRRMYGFYAFQK